MANKRSNKPPTIAFKFVKANQHRVIHVDGAWGGVTPYGGIHMSVYSEIPSIPDRVVRNIQDGKLGSEVRREGDSDILRELEATLVMNLGTASVLRDWLDDKIKRAETLRKESKGATS